MIYKVYFDWFSFSEGQFVSLRQIHSSQRLFFVTMILYIANKVKPFVKKSVTVEKNDVKAR